MPKARQYVYSTYKAALRECGHSYTLCVWVVCANVQLGHIEPGRSFYVVASSRDQAAGRLATHMMLVSAEHAQRPSELDSPTDCKRCNGYGGHRSSTEPGVFWSYVKCKECHGLGVIDHHRTGDPEQEHAVLALAGGEFTAEGEVRP